MRVRESMPDHNAVAAHYAIAHDSLDLIASFEQANRMWVITEYLSKVGTWRRLRKMEKPSHITLNRDKVQEQVWLMGYEALEGAPEWLREAWIREQMEHDYKAPVALRVSYRPKDLP